MADSVDTQADPATYWEERYASGAMKWSGNPNDLLVVEAESLEPGTVLDLGCGTGGDAIWFASLGWDVLAVDIAPSAMEQAGQHAAEAGVGERIRFEQHDLDATFPAGEFDLVSAPYLQSMLPFGRLAVLGQAAAAVAPGGRLVVVAHESFPSGNSHGHDDVYMPTAPQLFEDLALSGGEWELVKAESIPRQKVRDGQELNYRDNVLHLRRVG